MTKKMRLSSPKTTTPRTIRPCTGPLSSADKANDTGSIGIGDVMPVAASKPQKMRDDYCRTPESVPDFHGSNAPPASMLHDQEKASAVKRWPTALPQHHRCLGQTTDGPIAVGQCRVQQQGHGQS
jgi:hypothetical protein